MRGLLLKDFYLMIKYCKMYFLIILLFSIGGAGGQSFLSFYPCFFAGMIPVTLLAYDERSRWNAYAGTLPYKKSALVTSKYLIGLLCGGAFFLFSGALRGLGMSLNGTFSPDMYFGYLALLLLITFLSFSLSLPFMFGLGAEKGRIAYAAIVGVMVVICSAGAVISPDIALSDTLPLPHSGFTFLLAVIISAVIYLASWGLSVLLYCRRNDK